MTNYMIKRNFGDQNFEVSGPEKEWVEAQAEALAAQFTTEKPGLTQKQNLTRRRSSNTSKPAKTNSKVADTEKRSGVAPKLNTTAIDQLIQYVGDRQKAFDKTAPNQAVIIAKFLKEVLSVDEIDKDDLAYIYKQVGAWKLVDHGNQLENATKRNNYFTRNGGTYKLTYAGEKFAQDNALNIEKA